jgi:Fe-S oxidoreductase
VVLWIDSFNNAFSPQVLEAAVVVFEHHGVGVQIIQRHVCCGRPFYDVGMLDEARANLNAILNQVEPFLWKHYPIVVLEPSCLSVFRDELPALFPDDKRAQVLSRAVVTFAEFVERENIPLPEAVKAPHIHGHCHQKACGGMNAEQSLLAKMDARDHLLNTGCCGMAGAYGYNAKTEEVSKKIGRDIWAPQLSNVPDDDVVVADGFSCRSQAANVAGRHALHLAEWMALQILNQRGAAEQNENVNLVRLSEATEI